MTSTIDEKTKVPIVAFVGVTILVVPLTLFFASIRETANAAQTKNIEQQATIEVLQKDLSDIKADIREIKTVLKIKKGGRE